MDQARISDASASNTCGHDPLGATVTCDECPWRTDVCVGNFPPERFVALADTSKQGFGPLFACHKTADGAEHACVGWLLGDGPENLRVRLALAQGTIDLDSLVARGPIYESYGDMAEANGLTPEQVDALGVRSARRRRAEELELE